MILDYFLKNFGGKFLLRCNYDISKLKNKIPQYYRDCLKPWISLRPPADFEFNIVEEITWNNTQILVKNKMIYVHTVKDKRIAVYQ